MRRHLAVMTCLALVPLLCCRGADARVRLNAIRTVILREEQAPPVNRSAWEPSLDLTLYQCMSDLECAEGSYCHAPAKGPAHSRCHSCRRRKRPCHRDGMCCPGNNCTNNVCVPDADALVSQRLSDGDMSSLWKKRGWRKTRRMEAKGPSGQVGDPCLRSSDCSHGLCCARHFWTRICKPVLREGQVCTRHRRKAGHGLELFQRCPCGHALRCGTLRGPGGARPAAAAETRSSSPARHSSPDTSLLSAASKPPPSPTAAKTRLHVCQKN